MMRAFCILIAAAATGLGWYFSSFGGAHGMVMQARSTGTKRYSRLNDAELHTPQEERKALQGNCHDGEEPISLKREWSCAVLERRLEEETKKNAEKEDVIRQQHLIIADLSATLRALTSPGPHCWGADQPSVVGDGAGTNQYSAGADDNIVDWDDVDNQQNGSTDSPFYFSDTSGVVRGGDPRKWSKWQRYLHAFFVIPLFAFVFIVLMDHITSRKREVPVLIGADLNGESVVTLNRILEGRTVELIFEYGRLPNFALLPRMLSVQFSLSWRTEVSFQAAVVSAFGRQLCLAYCDREHVPPRPFQLVLEAPVHKTPSFSLGVTAPTTAPPTVRGGLKGRRHKATKRPKRSLCRVHLSSPFPAVGLSPEQIWSSDTTDPSLKLANTIDFDAMLPLQTIQAPTSGDSESHDVMACDLFLACLIKVLGSPEALEGVQDTPAAAARAEEAAAEFAPDVEEAAGDARVTASAREAAEAFFIYENVK